MKTLINYPNLCAWCGTNSPYKYINVGKSGFQITGCLLFWVQYRYRSYTLQLPICFECEKKINLRKTTIRRISVLSSIVIASLYLFLKQKNGEVFDSSFIPEIILCVLFGLFLGSVIGDIVCKKRDLIHRKQSWGYYRDGSISIRNSRFYEAMRELNPQLYISKTKH